MNASAIALVLILVAGVGCAALVGRVSGRSEACEILAIGTAATARIERLIDTGTSINDDPVIEFLLEVMPADAAPYPATTKALVSRLDVPQVQPGRIVPVKFDPQAPNRIALDLWQCPQP